MSKSKERYSKREKERKRQKQKQEKAEKRQQRKENNNKGKKLEDMMAYLDSEGNLTSKPPDKTGNTLPGTEKAAPKD